MLGVMSGNGRSPAQYASDIDEACERLVALAERCTDEQWNAAPLDGDPRPVGVVVDHVADSYEYLAGWMRRVLAGQAVTVTADIVDALNAEHAVAAAEVTRPGAVDHLRRSGADLSALVAGCGPGQLRAAEGQAERLAQVAIRHADNHRAEIEAGLAAIA
jgi:hypothetical protein